MAQTALQHGEMREGYAAHVATLLMLGWSVDSMVGTTVYLCPPQSAKEEYDLWRHNTGRGDRALPVIFARNGLNPVHPYWEMGNYELPPACIMDIVISYPPHRWRHQLIRAAHRLEHARRKSSGDKTSRSAIASGYKLEKYHD